MEDYGMDVSRYQNKPITDKKGNIIGYEPLDYAKAAGEGIAFAGVRATVGDYYIDPTFVMNYMGFLEVKVEPLPYMVTAPREKDGGRKIDAYQHMDKYQEALSLLPVKHTGDSIADNELTRGAGKWEITALFEKLFSLLPRPLNYTRASWWDANVLRSKNWKRVRLIVAHYDVENPTLPLDYNTWYIHQYSADGNLLGPTYGCYSKSVDLDKRQFRLRDRIREYYYRLGRQNREGIFA